MQDLVEHIQKVFVRDVSPALTPLITALLQRVIQDVWYYHHWSFLLDDVTDQSLTTLEEYNLSGNNNDLGRILNIWYSDKTEPLEKVDRTQFRKEWLNQVQGGTPACWYPVKKLTEYTWRVRIYPTSGTSLENVTYAYQMKIDYSKIRLFDNPMVFILGTLRHFFANEKQPQKARDYKQEYEQRRDEMMRRDSAVIYPVKRIVHPPDTKNIRTARRDYRTLRRR